MMKLIFSNKKHDWLPGDRSFGVRVREFQTSMMELFGAMAVF